MSLHLDALRARYRDEPTAPSEVVSAIYDRIERDGERPLWISLVPREAALQRARAIEAAAPLYGIPFAVKDNIDLAGLPTTAGCPSYAYSPSRNATVVQRLIAAGAICVGKTNMDQFATGLVGTRSPYGACSSVFDAGYISGGSSSGSAVAVARGLVSFALGTDTAGSGRVPAAFNGLVGLKPTRGLLSTSGVVPACRSLDCVSIFANNCNDALAVLNVAAGADPADPYSRQPADGDGAAAWLQGGAGGSFRFGVPSESQLEFFGDQAAAKLYGDALRQLEKLGGVKVEIDFSVFYQAADLLYKGPWVAERLAAIEPFFVNHAREMDPVVASIIGGAKKYTAVDAFRAEYRLRELRREALEQFRSMDVLVLPTAPTIYTHQEIAAEPVRLNSNLGYYTNFVNLLDLAAVAVPAGFRENGLPFGISFIGMAFTDVALLTLADRYHRSHTTVPGAPLSAAACPPGCVLLAVVGAHLSGQPLNGQLTERHARLFQSTHTDAHYRLYALAGTAPAKPGLIRDETFQGKGIEVEVWAVPKNEFGGFVAAVPPPLGIGNVTLADGSVVNGFICEPYALSRSLEITKFEGWRAYLAAVPSNAGGGAG